jgi:hybrid cluster-associated redox disulfide protein
MIIDSKMTVSDLLKIHPSVMNVFIKRKMLCVGCPAESFHTLEDVARIYGIALETFLRELQVAISSQHKMRME